MRFGSGVGPGADLAGDRDGAGLALVSAGGSVAVPNEPMGPID